MKLPKRLPKFDLDLDRYKSPDPATNRQIIVISVAIILLMGVSAASAFLLGLKGEDKTMVPDLLGKDYITATMELKERHLFPNIVLRDPTDSSPRGSILDQEPNPGSIVKASRLITLYVSKGELISKVDNFVGQNLSGVRLHLMSSGSGISRSPLSIKDPPSYVYDSREEGTILQQKPLPGSPVNGPTQLEFVVSRGPMSKKVTVPTITGRKLSEAMKALEESGLVADFTVRPRDSKEAAETIVTQLPAPGSSIDASSRLSLVLTEPEGLGKGQVFGLVSETLPKYPSPIKLTVDALLPSGARQRLYSVNHPGGSLTFPYILPPGSFVIVSIPGEEKFKIEVKAAQ